MGDSFLSKQASRGFTLIELLMVMSIMVLIFSIAASAMADARAKTRDNERKAGLKQLQLALEYYRQMNGSYPTTAGSWYSSEAGDVVSNNAGSYIPGLAPTYITTLPRDPGGRYSTIVAICGSAVWKQAFLYRSNGVEYKLLSHCAPERPMSATDPFYDPVRPTWAWAVCSSRAACDTW